MNHDDVRRTVAIEVNGVLRHAQVEDRTTLADCLRDGFRLVGTHLGCEHGACGACTVLVDGHTARSCLMLAAQAQGHAITTVEGLADGAALGELQQALREHHGLQCGFCTPGVLMTLTELLADHPRATEDEVRLALSGHLCRCTGYQNIVEAALAVLDKRRGAAWAR
jgi:aerobic-type carbon monoxide dehydrogenase small subunit (CoxS/CutS family)